MPHDPVRAQEAQAWLGRARADLRAAEDDLAADPPLAEDAVFHCQQASEKALKGFLAWHDRPFRKTHKLEELGEQCLALDERLRAEVDCAVPLTEFAWRYRYPGEPEQLARPRPTTRSSSRVPSTRPCSQSSPKVPGRDRRRPRCRLSTLRRAGRRACGPDWWRSPRHAAGSP